jgi:hypothetical protein
VSAVTAPARPTRSDLAAAVRSAVVLTAWALSIALARVVGQHLYDVDPRIHVGNPPLVGSADLHAQPWILPALAFALAAVIWGPRLADRLRERQLLAAAYGAALAWPALLAAADGIGALPAPLASRYEYLHDVGRVASPGSFLSHFTAQLPTYATHVKGHPPGMLLVLWALNRVGLGGATPATVLVLAVGALAAPAVLIAVRELAGVGAMRATAPFVALVPGAVWIATSADALFMGVGACGIALVALASGRHDARGDALALGGGLTLGALLMLTYGAVPLGAIVLAIALHRRRVRPLLLAGIGVAAVFAVFALAGFWWFEGLHATRELYASGVASRRPYLAFLLIDLAALALATGPALAAGLGRLRGGALWVLPGGALVAIALADLSGLSRGETERIWLPFVPWLLVATAALTTRRRGWLAAQLALALALQVGIRSPW